MPSSLRQPGDDVGKAGDAAKWLAWQLVYTASHIPCVEKFCILLSMFTEDQQTRIAEWGERRHELRDRLIVLGDRRRRLRAEQAEVSTELRRLLPEAVAVRWRVSDLARWAGMTRKAVYDILAAVERVDQS